MINNIFEWDNEKLELQPHRSTAIFTLGKTDLQHPFKYFAI